jgi:cytochrome c551/c552
MIKFLFVLAIVFIVLSCSKRTVVTKTENVVATTDTLSLTIDEIEKGRELIARSDCFTCHKFSDGELTGPTYKKIAERYTVSTGTISKLVKKYKQVVKVIGGTCL